MVFLYSENDETTPDGIKECHPEAVIISPGPGRPEEAGISKSVIKQLGPSIPTLGICLGHQCIGEVFGGRVDHANEILHGKTSIVRHGNHQIFNNISNPFNAARYHSLVIKADSLPDELEEIAVSDDGTIMAVAHSEYPIIGMQFHPESAFTNVGLHLIKNFLTIVDEFKPVLK